jgi:hypothetical protein
MSYLTQYATRVPASIRAAQTARVDERTPLNLPDFDGGAHVRVFVEDTSARRRRLRRTPPHPRIRLRIADCVHEANLEFSLETAELRENALHKIDTLLGALHRFRDALVEEAELYALRERGRNRKEARCRT